MDENTELYTILASFKEAFEALFERVSAQDEMIGALRDRNDELYDLVVNQVLEPAKQAMDEFNYNSGLDAFGTRYADKFEGYNDKLRAIEGEDFDVVKEAYDTYNAYEGEDKPEEGAYVDEFIANIDGQLDGIREALGVSEDAEVVIKDDGKGEVEVEVDGEKVTEDGDEEEKVEDEEKIVDDTEEEVSDEDELKAYEEELLKYKK